MQISPPRISEKCVPRANKERKIRITIPRKRVNSHIKPKRRYSRNGTHDQETSVS